MSVSKKKHTEFTCGACGHTFTPKVKTGEGVMCPECGSSDQLSSRVVTAKKDDEAGDDDKDGE